MLPSLPRLRLPAVTEFAETGGPLRSLSLVDLLGFLRAMLLPSAERLPKCLLSELVVEGFVFLRSATVALAIGTAPTVSPISEHGGERVGSSCIRTGTTTGGAPDYTSTNRNECAIVAVLVI